MPMNFQYDLPNIALQHIMNFLPLKEVAFSICSCPNWKRIIDSKVQNVWKAQCQYLEIPLIHPDIKSILRFNNRILSLISEYDPEHLNYKELLRNPPIPDNAIGPLEWEMHIGKISPPPLLPSSIYKTMHSLCPFFKNKTVEETHVLVFLPKKVNGRCLTLKSIEEI